MVTNFIDTLAGGSKVYVRPIRRDDIEQERRFVDALSPQSRYFRFLGGVSHLTEEELEKLCDVDQSHEMAFVALDQSAAEDVQVGVARYVARPDRSDAEVAVTIADDWQDKGLDEILLRHLIDYAREREIESLYTIELASNTNMRVLAQKLGFDSQSDPDDCRQVIHRLMLQTADSRPYVEAV